MNNVITNGRFCYYIFLSLLLFYEVPSLSCGSCPLCVVYYHSSGHFDVTLVWGVWPVIRFFLTGAKGWGCTFFFVLISSESTFIRTEAKIWQFLFRPNQRLLDIKYINIILWADSDWKVWPVAVKGTLSRATLSSRFVFAPSSTKEPLRLYRLISINKHTGILYIFLKLPKWNYLSEIQWKSPLSKSVVLDGLDKTSDLIERAKLCSSEKKNCWVRIVEQIK